MANKKTPPPVVKKKAKEPVPPVDTDTGEQPWDPTPDPAITEQEEDAKWDGSNEPAAEPVTETVQADGWGSETKTVMVPLEIETHTGMFDPDVVKMLIYGESGTGKSRLASTFPNVIFADMDHGMSSVTEKIQKVYIGENEFKKLELMYEYLKAGDHSFRTVVLDTLNEMQRFAMGATVEEFTTIRRSYNDLPSQSDYGKMLHDMIELTRKFIDLPMRVVLLAQVVSRQFDTDTLMPQLVGKNTSREICRKMDVVGYIYKSEKDNPKYPGKKLSEIAFDAASYVTKDRSFKLPAVLSDPSYSRISSFWK
jgi:hypothetical protein